MTAPAVTVDDVLELRSRIAAAQVEQARAAGAVVAAEHELGDALADGIEPGVRLRGTLQGARLRHEEAGLAVAALQRRLGALDAGSATPLVLVRALTEVRDEAGARRQAGETFAVSVAFAQAGISGGVLAGLDREQRVHTTL